MCYAVVEVKLKNESNSGELKRIDSKEALAKALTQYERLGTIEKVTVFYNHHTHRLVEKWEDEMYKEPVVEPTGAVA
jgi:hypothetical protein